jgi:hypothetical protein
MSLQGQKSLTGWLTWSSVRNPRKPRNPGPRPFHPQCQPSPLHIAHSASALARAAIITSACMIPLACVAYEWRGLYLPLRGGSDREAREPNHANDRRRRRL